MTAVESAKTTGSTHSIRRIVDGLCNGQPNPIWIQNGRMNNKPPKKEDEASIANKIIIRFYMRCLFFNERHPVIVYCCSVQRRAAVRSSPTNAFSFKFNSNIISKAIYSVLSTQRTTQVHKSQFNCDRASTENGNARTRWFDWLVCVCLCVRLCRARDPKIAVEDHCQWNVDFENWIETTNRRTGYPNAALLSGCSCAVVIHKLPLADQLW